MVGQPTGHANGPSITAATPTGKRIPLYGKSKTSERTTMAQRHTTRPRSEGVASARSTTTQASEPMNPCRYRSAVQRGALPRWHYEQKSPARERVLFRVYLIRPILLAMVLAAFHARDIRVPASSPCSEPSGLPRSCPRISPLGNTESRILMWCCRRASRDLGGRHGTVAEVPNLSEVSRVQDGNQRAVIPTSASLKVTAVAPARGQRTSRCRR